MKCILPVRSKHLPEFLYSLIKNEKEASETVQSPELKGECRGCIVERRSHRLTYFVDTEKQRPVQIRK